MDTTVRDGWAEFLDSICGAFADASIPQPFFMCHLLCTADPATGEAFPEPQVVSFTDIESAERDAAVEWVAVLAVSGLAFGSVVLADATITTHGSTFQAVVMMAAHKDLPHIIRYSPLGADRKIGAWKPLFLESKASMLSFIPSDDTLCNSHAVQAARDIVRHHGRMADHR